VSSPGGISFAAQEIETEGAAFFFRPPSASGAFLPAAVKQAQKIFALETEYKLTLVGCEP
jgi:hypothetical protein